MVGLPPIAGLYSGIFGPLVYALFGSSRHTSTGTFAIAALMMGSVVKSEEQHDNALNASSCYSSEVSLLSESKGQSERCCVEAGLVQDETSLQRAEDVTAIVCLLTGVFQVSSVAVPEPRSSSDS